MGAGLRGVRWGVSDSYRSHYKALRCVLWFCTVFNLIFDYSNFGEGVT